MIYLIEYYSISMIYSILVISYIYVMYVYIQYVYCIILHTCMDSPRKKKIVQWVDRHGKNNVAMLYPTIPANHDLPSGNQTWHAQKIWKLIHLIPWLSQRTKPPFRSRIFRHVGLPKGSSLSSLVCGHYRELSTTFCSVEGLRFTLQRWCRIDCTHTLGKPWN
jgi:hypothetical protein